MSDELQYLNMSDLELTILAQSGNKVATDTLINRYVDVVHNVSSRFFMSGFESDDIFQEGMIGLYSAILDYKDGKSSFKTFACLCITRKIISTLKASKRQKNIPLNSSLSLDVKVHSDSEDFLIDTLKNSNNSNPENILISKENMKHFEKTIDECLSKLEYQVFLLHIDGLSYKEIAEKLGKDVKGVDNAIQRIKKKLLVLFE